MKILTINKESYRKKSNLVMVGFIGCLAGLALLFGALLIALFGATPDIDSASTGNFHLNLIGVVLAVITSVILINKVKTHEYFTEIMYVWHIKKLHNLIYRKFTKIKAAAERNDVDALTILAFYYTTQKQVFDLDNNTLTITSVQKNLNELYEQASAVNLTISADNFTTTLIDKF